MEGKYVTHLASYPIPDQRVTRDRPEKSALLKQKYHKINICKSIIDQSNDSSKKNRKIDQSLEVR